MSTLRAWSDDQAVLPHIQFVDADLVRIEHIRDAQYRSATDYEVRYLDRTYDLRTISGVRLAVASFWGYNIGHTYLIFDFTGTPSLAVSIEARRGKGEEFNLRALLPKHFGLMYVLAEPRDLEQIHAHIKGEKMRFTPLKMDQRQTRALLTDMLQHAHKLERHAAWYHPWYQSCSLNMVWHMRRIGLSLPRVHWRYYFPERLDKVFARAGLAERQE